MGHVLRVNLIDMTDKTIIPFGFSMLESGLYRSSYPTTASLPYIAGLRLKTMISVDGYSARSELREFISKNSIQLIECDVGQNQEPFEVMSVEAVSRAVRAAIDVDNSPCLIYSCTERMGLSIVCACIRKQRKWPLTSIMREFEQFTQPEGSFHDIQYIDSFELVPTTITPDDNAVEQQPKS